MSMCFLWNWFIIIGWRNRFSIVLSILIDDLFIYETNESFLTALILSSGRSSSLISSIYHLIKKTFNNIINQNSKKKKIKIVADVYIHVNHVLSRNCGWTRKHSIHIYWCLEAVYNTERSKVSTYYWQRRYDMHAVMHSYRKVWSKRKFFCKAWLTLAQFTPCTAHKMEWRSWEKKMPWIY